MTATFCWFYIKKIKDMICESFTSNSSSIVTTQWVFAKCNPDNLHTDVESRRSERILPGLYTRNNLSLECPFMQQGWQWTRCSDGRCSDHSRPMGAEGEGSRGANDNDDGPERCERASRRNERNESRRGGGERSRNGRWRGERSWLSRKTIFFYSWCGFTSNNGWPVFEKRWRGEQGRGWQWVRSVLRSILKKRMIAMLIAFAMMIVCWSPVHLIKNCQHSKFTSTTIQLEHFMSIMIFMYVFIDAQHLLNVPNTFFNVPNTSWMSQIRSGMSQIRFSMSQLRWWRQVGAPPLCVEWLQQIGSAHSSNDSGRGNYAAVGSFGHPLIEIW